MARAVTRKPRRTKLVEKAAIPRSPATNCYAALSLGRGDPRRRSLPDAQPKKIPTQTAIDKSATIPAKEHALPRHSHPLPTPKTEKQTENNNCHTSPDSRPVTSQKFKHRLIECLWILSRRAVPSLWDDRSFSFRQEACKLLVHELMNPDCIFTGDN